MMTLAALAAYGSVHPRGLRTQAALLVGWAACQAAKLAVACSAVGTCRVAKQQSPAKPPAIGDETLDAVGTTTLCTPTCSDLW
jgi:hypothetical protein